MKKSKVRKMTKKQEEHLESIKSLFSTLVDSKYRKGQAEHGGNLFDMSVENLLDCALDEAIDQVVYLLTITKKMIDER